ncbi:Uncharacterised protein [uncultured archaeon]|nr:Uncharacterised protein [uncultured archaeon]
MENKNFSYDSYSDSLIIINRQENEIVRKNFEVGDIIFSLTGKGKIVGIEIREFSSFLESCNLDSKIAETLSSVEFIINVKKEAIFSVLKIGFLQGNVEVTKNIPLVMPLINQ